MTATAALLSNIATINPLAARFCVSPRASQHATPSESKPALQTRATVRAAGVSSGKPASISAVADGKHTSAKSAPTSMTAVTLWRVFTDEQLFNSRQLKAN
jgi:hypothetical protein